MPELKILHITTFKNGGAGIAAMRLQNALLQYGYSSKFLFLEKGNPSANVFQYRKKIYLWELVLRILKKLGLPPNLEQKNDYSIRKYKYQVEMFSFSNTPYVQLHEHPLVKECDVVHLHWVVNFLDYKTFFGNINKPVVWTLHDMNPFLGGFHYKEDENRFLEYMLPLNERQLTIKRNALQKVATNKLTIVAPSAWLCRLSKQSETLGRFQHYAIPNCVDTTIFKETRRTEKTNDKRKINVLLVSESLHNYRKGFDLVLDLLQDKEIINLCSFTAVGHVKNSSKLPHVVYPGIIETEQRMSELYNEADIFLLPSREDNLPNSMVESLCCGTPVVGFAIGGLPETITNGENGYLSDELTSAGIEKALLNCIRNINKLDRKKIAGEAYKKFSFNAQSKAFSDLYRHCLQPEKPTLIDL